MLESKPPIAFTSAGKVYRKDDDATHLPMFHQVEGIYVDENVTFANLKDLFIKLFIPCLEMILNYVFVHLISHLQNHLQKLIYYQKMINGSKFLDGVVNPVVLENCNIDSKKFSGLAFGLGIERIAMLKHGVNDIREFYKSNLIFRHSFK